MSQAPVSSPQKGSIINFPIRDLVTLYASYMPFINGGGLFIPSNRQVNLGDEMFVLVNLPESSERLPISGKVVWISRTVASGKSPGFGISLSGAEGQRFKNEVEHLLAGQLGAEMPTFTM